MLKLNWRKWADYKEDLQINTLAELAEYLKVPYRTLQSWWLGERKPPMYTENMINDKLNERLRFVNIRKALEAGEEVKKAEKDGINLSKEKKQLIESINHSDRRGIANAILQISIKTNVYTDFLDILLMDWDFQSNDKDLGFFYSVLATFTMKII